MSFVRDKTVCKGRPENTQGRLPKEVRTYDRLDSLGIEYTRLDHEAIYTVEGCDEVDRLLDITICKNLFLCDRKKQNFYLLMLPGNKKYEARVFSKVAMSSRLSFAPEEYMEKYLDITPGSVSVLGLMNDVENKVRLYIDRDILEDEYLGCHPCVNTSSLKIKMKDILEKFLPSTGHGFTLADLSPEE